MARAAASYDYDCPACGARTVHVDTREDAASIRRCPNGDWYGAITPH